MDECTALVPRLELRLADRREPVIAGFHRDGRLAIYFGGGPYYQFDGEGRLRRALVDERLLRSQGSTLAELTRLREAGAVELRRRDLDQRELAAFFAALRRRLEGLLTELERGRALAVRREPPGEPIEERLIASLRSILNRADALAPALNRAR
jgi:hypothetical protein